jgi:hypothetical protein
MNHRHAHIPEGTYLQRLSWWLQQEFPLAAAATALAGLVVDACGVDVLLSLPHHLLLSVPSSPPRTKVPATIKAARRGRCAWWYSRMDLCVTMALSPSAAGILALFSSSSKIVLLLWCRPFVPVWWWWI